MSAAKARPAGVPNGATRQAILDYLVREADLDGVVTLSTASVGEAFGITPGSAALHMRNLVVDGAIRYRGRVQGVSHHPIAEYQLLGEEWS